MGTARERGNDNALSRTFLRERNGNGGNGQGTVRERSEKSPKMFIEQGFGGRAPVSKKRLGREREKRAGGFRVRHKKVSAETFGVTSPRPQRLVGSLS